MQISLIVPLLDEQESLTELCKWIKQVLEEKFSYEIIFVDDGSKDGSWEVLQVLFRENKNIRVIKFLKNYGKSQALQAGFGLAKGKVIITMDADLQDNPEEIPHFYRLIEEEGYDLVCGWKKVRYDAYFSKNLPSKLFNYMARKVSGLKLHDFNCGLKSFRKEILEHIDLYGGMHRYIPLLVKSEGYTKITEKIVKHQSRKYGKTKFGRERFIKGLLDLITIWFILKFGKTPMHFFGFLGLLMFILGLGFTTYLGIDKLFIHQEARLIVERPEFYLALASTIIGVQFFTTGFICELLLRRIGKKKLFRIKETL